MARRLLIALVLLGSLACGPTRSSTLIVDAAAELAAARTAQAPGVAPYEFIAAEEYLHKAREEQSYADFEVSERLARKARDCARAARYKAEAQTRSEIGASQRRARNNAVCRAGPVTDAEEDAAERASAPPPRQTRPSGPQTEQKPKKPVVPKDEPADPLPEGEDPDR